MNDMSCVIINKNRGWRGLAQVIVRDEDHKEITKMIFSFSQAVWDDLLLRHLMVIQDNEYYYVLSFHEVDTLNLPVGHQRSVLIKNWVGNIKEVNRYKKSAWTLAPSTDWMAINNFIKNRNNHTTSDWNCIGVRVIPEI